MPELGRGGGSSSNLDKVMSRWRLVSNSGRSSVALGIIFLFLGGFGAVMKIVLIGVWSEMFLSWRAWGVKEGLRRNAGKGKSPGRDRGEAPVDDRTRRGRGGIMGRGRLGEFRKVAQETSPCEARRRNTGRGGRVGRRRNTRCSQRRRGDRGGYSADLYISAALILSAPSSSLPRSGR